MNINFKQIVTESAQLIGFDKPDVKEDFYALIIDGIRVLIEPTKSTETGEESLYFCAHLETLENRENQHVTDFILEKNIDFKATGSASIGVLPEQNILAIYQLLPVEINRAELLIAELNKFVDIAEQIKKDVTELKFQSVFSNQPTDNGMLSV